METVNSGLLKLWATATSIIAFRYVFFAGVAFVLFYWVFKDRLSARKIQSVFPKSKDYRRDITYSLITSAIFGVQIILVLFVFRDYTRLYSDPAKYSIAYHVFCFIAMIFIHDTYFYWTHRLMHHPHLFKYFHLVHHKSHNPSPWASYAFHPLEAIVEGGIVPVIAFLLPVWTPLFIAFLIFQLMVNVYGHTGYELLPENFHRTSIGRWINTSVSHNMHHKYFDCNYSLYFMIWDRIMGTVHRKYDKTYDEVTAPKAKL